MNAPDKLDEGAPLPGRSKQAREPSGDSVSSTAPDEFEDVKWW